MTNEELFADLKQFITATVSQQMAAVATKDDIADLRADLKGEINSVRTELKSDIKTLDEKLDLIQDAIAETLAHTTEEVTNTTLQDHERRLRRLEHRSA